MKIFWKYIFPIIFGLTAYTTIRVVTDTTTGEKFWERHWQINAIEIVIVILLSFVFDRILRYYIRKFNSRGNAFNGNMVLREFGQIALVFFILLNPVIYLVHILIRSPENWSDFTIANVIVLSYVLLYYAISRGNNFIKAWIEQQLQIEKIRTDQLESELKFLKAQYHPHFLFNALNTIYFQMDENVAEAKKSVEKFSELLRYQLYDQQQMVPVSQEIHYLQNFIDLQRVRSSDKLQLDVNFDPALNGQQVYPLLFLPLVENAFKYVGGNYQMNIKATGSGTRVAFFIENSVPSVIPDKKESGIGLENLKRRLELLYPGKHELIIKKEDEKFKVSLVLLSEADH
jgi:sensor histidine kinase YesM